MIIKNKTQVLSTCLLAVSVVSCSKISGFSSKTVSQIQTEISDRRDKQINYPDSALIYNVCHERWLRNGYANYTFNIEEGSYQPSREIQRGKFTQVVVSNHQISQSASCMLDYNPNGASCDQNTRRRSKDGFTVDGLFEEWEKNPSLYQSCHPVLGYPTGYGHTYGVNERRIDSSEWFLVSSVIPRKSTRVTTAHAAETRVSSPVRVKPKVAGKTAKTKIAKVRKNKARTKTALGEFSSVSELDIKVLSSRVKKASGRSSLISQFNVINQTDRPALLGIKGWILDKNYNRYPLSTDGKRLKKGDESQIVTLEVGAHTQMTVSYEADGVSNIKLGKQTVGMLEVMSVDGVKINLTLPGR
jgi:hypothetical protein